MKISFLLPGLGCKPGGGYKIVYEYANRLILSGFDVEILYPIRMYGKGFKPIIGTIYRLFMVVIGKYSCKKWFDLYDNVKESVVWDLKEKNVPSSDYYIATACHTSRYLNLYNSVDENHKIYYIQGYEVWGGETKQSVVDTYRFNMRKITTSKWLHKKILQYTEYCERVPLGFDFSYFQKQIDFAQRNNKIIAMLYHKEPSKGCAICFAALDKVKKKYPQLIVNIFGVSNRPKNLPDWYIYYKRPNKQEHNHIYNESAIFIGASSNEGWGLTIGEAMICGAAVVCTETSGYLEMAIDNKTALVSPIGDIEALANNIILLIENDSLRIRLAQRGNQYIKQFSWENSYESFINFIQQYE